MLNLCHSCSALCCRKLIIEIQPSDMAREPKLLPVATPLDTGEYRIACGSNHPCQMLGSDNRCTIYNTRPDACRLFPVGGEHCMELREEVGL